MARCVWGWSWHSWFRLFHIFGVTSSSESTIVVTRRGEEETGGGKRGDEGALMDGWKGGTEVP